MNVPKLRFKEFSNDWKDEKLEDVVDFLDDRRKPIKDSDRNNIKGIYPYYGASGIIDYINDYIFDEELLLLGEDGANILSRSTQLVFKATGKYWVNNHAHVLRPKENYNIDFLESCLENINYEPYNTGTAQPKLNQEVCRKINIKTPSLKEQVKIGKTLSLLDKKIELQTKKIEILKLFKLCISNLCFNAHKNWNYKISDFCYITTSTSKIKYIDSSGKRYIMDMGTINSDGNIIYSKPTNYNKNLLNKGDLIMPKDDIGGGLIIGKTAYIDQNNKYILGDHVFCLKSKNINSLYLHYLINSSYINKSLRKKVTGSAQLGINSKNVLNQDIFVHEKKGQDVIANTLFIIDSKILLNKIKLEKLLSLKKGFMQNMFI